MIFKALLFLFLLADCPLLLLLSPAHVDFAVAFLCAACLFSMKTSRELLHLMLLMT